MMCTVATTPRRLLRIAPSVAARYRIKSSQLSWSSTSAVLCQETSQSVDHLANTTNAPFSRPLIFSHDRSFYNYLFSKLKSPPDLFEARKLHARLVVSGFFHDYSDDKVLGSQLVHVYFSFGCLHDALVVFDELPRKGKLAYNAVLRGFVERDRFSEAIEFYDLMLNGGVVPDHYTYPLVLKACSGLKDLKRGRRIRDLILSDELNLKCNAYVQCTLIDMFAKCGSLVEAREVFDFMPAKDLASWSAMISGALYNGQWPDAFDLFKRMRMDGLRPDSIMVTTLVPVCGRLEARKQGTALHSHAITGGFDCDLFLSNALIDFYSKCGEMNAARALFSSMLYKDDVSWSTLIAGYSQNGSYHESLHLYLEMKETGIRANGIITASVLPALGKLKLLQKGRQIHNFVMKQGVECDVVVWSALIEMYSGCGSLREAVHIFKLISDQDISSWNSMISGHSLNDDVNSAFDTFRRIWESPIRPNSITLLCILPICTSMSNLRLGKQIHGYTIRTALEKCIPLMNSVIDMYCKCGYLQLGMNVFNQMTEKNVVTYNTVISAYGAYGLGETALLVFEQMKDLGITPNKVTFVALLSACSHAGLLASGWSIYNCMFSDYKITPGMEHYACVVDLFGRAGLLEDACLFIRKMPLEPDINVLGSLLGACRLKNDVQLADILSKLVLRKNINDSGYYILLSNIYASVEKWDDALEVRTMIKEKGLFKDPGSSMIQVGSSIHKFHAGDKVHPELLKIYNNLALEMKKDSDTGNTDCYKEDL